jgi:ribosomal-protein-alanine N-acetyltransferase
MHTENLFIRPITLDDAEAYWPLVSLPEVLRYTGEQPLSALDDLRQTLSDGPIRDYEVYGFGRMACIENISGRVVGFSGLKFLEDLQEVDIGYRFLPECWGKGYATESARALMNHGALAYGIDRIVGLVQPANLASARVLKKVGLSFEREIKPGGCASNLALYATPGTGPNNSFKPKPLRGSA